MKKEEGKLWRQEDKKASENEEPEATRLFRASSCPTLCSGQKDAESAAAPVLGLMEGKRPLGKVKVQRLIRIEGFSIYYKMHYTNTTDRKV